MRTGALPAALLAFLLATLSAAWLPAWADDETLPTLRRKLMTATGDLQVGSALDALTQRVGQDATLPDHGAFGDWLGNLPSGKGLHPLVQQRRGWAYVVAKRGPEAIQPLEAALKDEPGNSLTRAYLGEALRQAGRNTAALEMLATAIVAGERGPHVKESASEAALGLRRSGEAARAEGLPRYATGLRTVLDARADPELDAQLAQWLLADLAAFGDPTTIRGRLWATTAATHALRAIRTAAEPIGGGAQMAFDAAVAVETADREAGGDTERFELLAHACRLGDALSMDGPHSIPKAFILLGEAALAEGRYDLAYRMARRRLDMSFSPRARRLLDALPPDLGLD